MKAINLKPLMKVLRGLLEGTLKLIATPTGKRTKVAAASTKKVKSGPPKKRGRKPLPATVKKQKAIKKQQAKIKKAKNALPESREVFVYLAHKYKGSKITEIAAHFKVKRSILAPVLSKLVAKGDLTQMGGKFFLQRRLRGVGGGKKVEKAPAITEKEVLGYLSENPGSTMSEMAKALGNGKYQKLIKVLNKLVKAEKVKKEGKGYRVGVVKGFRGVFRF